MLSDPWTQTQIRARLGWAHKGDRYSLDYLELRLGYMKSLEDRFAFLENVIVTTPSCERLDSLGRWVFDDRPRDLLHGECKRFYVMADKKFRERGCGSSIGFIY